MKRIIKDVQKLSNRADEIDTRHDGKVVQEVVLALKQVLRSKKDLRALSAPQLGYNYRIFVIKYDNKGKEELKTYVNPIITKLDNFTLSREKCSSLGGKEYIRPRFDKCFITYTTPLGKVESIETVGYLARLIQHHIDHLDGLLLSDVGLEVTEEYDKASEEEKNELIGYYLDSLDITRKEIEAEIESDKDLKQIQDGITFMSDLAKGEVSLTNEKLNINEQEGGKKDNE